MKFEQLKFLIEKRKRLILLKDISKNEDEIFEYELQIEETEEDIFGERGYSIPKLYKLFYVETETVKRFLQSYFNNKNIKSEIFYEGYYLNMMIYVNNKGYNLGWHSENVSLRCLYMGAWNDGWKELFEDYPDLVDFLWESYKNLKLGQKKEEQSLIRRRIEKNKIQLDFLTNQFRIEERVKELVLDCKNMEEKLGILSQEIDEFTCN